MMSRRRIETDPRRPSVSALPVALQPGPSAGDREPMTSTVTILDGGMGRELKRMGAPFRQPEWSALPLIEAPDFVRRAHLGFVEAGADVVTTNSYAIVPFHIGEERFAADGEALAASAGALARAAAEQRPGVRVAGSLPPLFGSYRPDLFDEARAPALLAPLIAGLSPHVDLWLAETMSSTAEARAVRQALATDPRPLWISFTLEDEADDAAAQPRLRSGEPVGDAARVASELDAAALLFNCSQPEVMGPALRSAAEALRAKGSSAQLGVYANAFPPQRKDAAANSELLGLRADLDPPAYLHWTRQWIADGASIVGGCCGIGPEHIAEMSRSLR